MFRAVLLFIIRSFSLYTTIVYTYVIVVCTVKNSRWWTEELSETCRVLFQKYIWEISASSWFYYKNLSRCTVTWTPNKCFIIYVRGIPLSQHKNVKGQSNYNIVGPIVTSTWLHERWNHVKKILFFRDGLQWRLNEVCPLKMTMSRWERKLFFDELVSKTGKGLRSRPNIMKKVPTLQHFFWDHRRSGYGKDPRNSGFAKM